MTGPELVAAAKLLLEQARKLATKYQKTEFFDVIKRIQEIHDELRIELENKEAEIKAKDAKIQALEAEIKRLKSGPPKIDVDLRGMGEWPEIIT